MLSLRSHIIYVLGDKPVTHGPHIFLYQAFLEFQELAFLTDGEMKVPTEPDTARFWPTPRSQCLLLIELHTYRPGQTEDKLIGLGLLGGCWLEATVGSNAFSLRSKKQTLIA